MSLLKRGSPDQKALSSDQRVDDATSSRQPGAPVSGFRQSRFGAGIVLSIGGKRKDEEKKKEYTDLWNLHGDCQR